MGYLNNEEENELYLERKKIWCVTFNSGRICGSVLWKSTGELISKEMKAMLAACMGASHIWNEGLADPSCADISIDLRSVGLELYGWSQYIECLGVCFILFCFSHGEKKRRKWWTSILSSSLMRSVCSPIRKKKINLTLQEQRNTKQLTSVLEESLRCINFSLQWLLNLSLPTHLTWDHKALTK